MSSSASGSRSNSGPDISDSQKRKRQPYNTFKCFFCRRDKQKCESSEPSRVANKCRRCDEKGYECSQREETDRNKKQRQSRLQLDPSKHLRFPSTSDDITVDDIVVLECYYEVLKMAWEEMETVLRKEFDDSIFVFDDKMEEICEEQDSAVAKLLKLIYELPECICNNINKLADTQSPLRLESALLLHKLPQLIHPRRRWLDVNDDTIPSLMKLIDQCVQSGRFECAFIPQIDLIDRLQRIEMLFVDEELIQKIRPDISCEGASLDKLLEQIIQQEWRRFAQIWRGFQEKAHKTLHKFKFKTTTSEAISLFVPESIIVDPECLLQLHEAGIEEDCLGRTMLHIAIDSCWCITQDNSLWGLRNEELLSRVNIFGHSPLHRACSRGTRIEVLQLLRFGAKPDARSDWQGETLLHLVARTGKLEILDALSSNASAIDLNSRNELNETPLISAARQDQVDIIGSLLTNAPVISEIDAVSDEGRTALHYAVEGGGYAAVSHLLEGGARVDTDDKSGLTPILTAFVHEHMHIIELLSAYRSTVLNHKSFSSETPLHTAVRNGFLEGVQYLLEQENVDLNPKTITSQVTPLMIAATSGCMSGYFRRQIIRMLASDRRVNLWEENIDGKTALDLVKDSPCQNHDSPVNGNGPCFREEIIGILMDATDLRMQATWSESL